jgi:5-methylthioadenosine/S-adenosylhomocysteine deaminase
MTSILLRNGYVVTVDPDRRVFPNGYVHVIGERIAAVGPMDQLAPAVADEVDEVLDVGGKLVIPGLINLHDHHWASLFKGFDEGEEMEPWLVSHVIPIAMSLTPGELRIASYVSSLEMLRYGVTCSVNHLANVNDADSYAGMAGAGQEVGVRQVLAKEVRGTPNPPFSTDYPAYPHIRSLDEEFALAEEIVRQWHGKDGVVHVGLATETGAFYMLAIPPAPRPFTAAWPWPTNMTCGSATTPAAAHRREPSRNSPKSQAPAKSTTSSALRRCPRGGCSSTTSGSRTGSWT